MTTNSDTARPLDRITRITPSMNPYYLDRLLLLLSTDNLFCMLFPACAGWDASHAYR